VSDNPPCTRCGKCCEEWPCGLAPVHDGRCLVYQKRKGIATCWLVASGGPGADVVRMLLAIGEGCTGGDAKEATQCPAPA